MSFRGGGGGNRGGNNSFNIPLGIAYQDILSQSQLHNSEVPKLSLPVNNSIITYREKLVASYCMNHLNNVKDSLFNLGEPQKSNNSNLIELDNSNDIERYGDKYLKHKKRDPMSALQDHPFHKDLFPDELFNVMGFNSNNKKSLQLKRFKGMSNKSTNVGGNGIGESALDSTTADGQDKTGLSMLEKLKELAEEVGNNVDEDEDEENNGKSQQQQQQQTKSIMDGIDEDEDFEEDEDDDDDYNAEKYFNDGDDDDDGYGDAGDDDEPAF